MKRTIYTKFILGAPLKFVTSDNKQFVDSQNREFLVPGKQIIGWLQRQTIDLAHGMVAKAEVILRK